MPTHRVCYNCAKDWASHTVTNGGHTEYFCCACYVAAGNPPADWHPDCMAASKRAHEQGAAEGSK